MRFQTLVAGLLALGAERAFAAPIEAEVPAQQLTQRSHVASMAMFEKRGLDCSNVPNLEPADCNRLSQMGFTNVGLNQVANGGANSIWVGKDGSFLAKFVNKAEQPLILVAWNQNADYASSFVQNTQPQLTTSIASGASQTISFANGATGAWAAIYNDTQLANGQLSQTWGEFAATGQYATVDVSREVNMNGNSMTIKTPGGCVSDMATCVFTCLAGNTCGTPGSYQLENCSGTGAAYGDAYGQPSGGCQGWSTGKALEVTFGK